MATATLLCAAERVQMPRLARCSGQQRRCLRSTGVFQGGGSCFAGRRRAIVSCFLGAAAALSALVFCERTAGFIQASRPSGAKGDLQRRSLAVSGFLATLAAGVPGVSALPAPGSGDCDDCLGVIDELLAPCRADLAGCVSSQDDRPEVFEAPWQIPVVGLTEAQASGQDISEPLKQLRRAVAADGGKVVQEAEGGRYVRAEFPVSGSPFGGEDVDDVEWYFTPDDTIVQFRAERRSKGGDFGGNKRRLESIRLRLGWELVPILRNRKRAFFFGESPFDTFGSAVNDGFIRGKEPTLEELEKLSKQGEMGESLKRRSGLSDQAMLSDPEEFADSMSRDFRRLMCDPKKQVCE
eukprot:TRINITY_DN56016_c0_g1_i1.p1 TRINITY_DN56016_c0_g1~~TRINITY_DN56016_c0_g1_i1.p1  ORF type:complete len:374 (-),score=65.73 TRINITY_DN56016_c0_g1_i1:537-1592(-)